MKLKKILSLALSGILAVSMLAGCGGGSIFNKDDRSSAFASNLNGAQKAVHYRTSDSDLNKAISTVADTLTAGQVKNGVADNNVMTTVRQITGYEDMNLVEWKTQEQVGSKTFVKVFVYDTENSAYDDFGEVVEAVADELAVMKLEATVDGTKVTNSYTGDVAAYETTIGEGDDAIEAIVVGVAITQTVKTGR